MNVPSKPCSADSGTIALVIEAENKSLTGRFTTPICPRATF